MGAVRSRDERIFILAPSANDGPVMARVLAEAGLESMVVRSVGELCQAFEEGAGALVIAEEALVEPEEAQLLRGLLDAQEPWSGLPVLLLAAGIGGGALPSSAESFRELGNVTVLDRPLRLVTLLSAARTALRSRRRQYAARAVLQELQAVLDAVPAAVFITRDPQARRMVGNRYTSDVLHLPAGANVSKSAPVEERPRAFRALKDGKEIPPEELPVQRVLASGSEVRDYAFEIAYEEGGIRHLYGNAAPLVGLDGDVKGAVGAFLDVTALRKAEAALREREAQFRTVIENSRDGISMLDLATGQYVLMSPAQCALTGFTESELHRMSAAETLDRVHPDDREAWLLQQRVIAAGEEPDGTVEYRWRVKSGEYRWFSDSRKLVRDERGEPVAVVGVSRDITDRKRADEELRLADQRKSEFIAVLSHELRNPLAPIRNSIHLLERAPPGGELARRGLEVLRRQSEHLERLVEDLLDVTRISHGKVELRLARLDARPLVARAVEDARQGFEHRGITLWFSDAADPIWIEADAARLTQMVGNLLHNALKFTPPGGRVDVSVGRAEGAAEISVRDSGAGIEPHQLEAIFDPFVQAERTRQDRHGGLGIGLSLVRALAEKHGGRIRAHSEGPGHGSTFVLQMPAASPPREVPSPGFARSFVPALSILVVEDNEDAAATLADLLALSGHQVTIAHSGRAGIEKALASRPDVLLCDVGLPDMSGHDVIRNVRAASTERTGGRVFAVALTGYAQPKDRVDALAAGFDAHLGKPPRLEELESLLSEAARTKYLKVVPR